MSELHSCPACKKFIEHPNGVIDGRGFVPTCPDCGGELVTTNSQPMKVSQSLKREPKPIRQPSPVRDNVKDLATDLCHFLESGWTVKDGEKSSWNTELVHEGGATLWISEGRDKTKWHIVGGVNVERARDYLPSSQEFPSVNVARSKSVDQIVRDIANRIMPELTPLIATIKERDLKHQAHVLICRNNSARLAELIGDKTELQSHNSGYQYSTSQYLSVKSPDEYNSNRYVKAEIHGERVDLRIDGLTVGEAEAIIRIAKGEQPFPPMGIETQPQPDLYNEPSVRHDEHDTYEYDTPLGMQYADGFDTDG